MGLRACLAAVVLLVGAPARAQSDHAQSDGPPPAKTGDSATGSVTITGERPTNQSLDSVVSGFVRSRTTLAPHLDQIIRWRKPICPLVRGVKPEFVTFITARIEGMAEEVGAPALTKATCKPDVEVIFTDQPQAMMDEVARKSPVLLGYHFVNQTQALAKVTKPIQAWYVTATSNGVDTYINDPYEMMPGGALGSRLDHGHLVSVFDHVLVVVDMTRINGRHLGPIADYVAMLTLAQPTPSGGCDGLPSLLDLFADTCPDRQKPEMLTSADKAYLEGLYSVTPEDVGPLQRAAIETHMLKSLDGP
ncbi:MAG: hypothetical protein PW843_27990 [Azospirillaceae bacterium]|nr:hypothetical protein [Azospirillaceae bacterium]